MDRVIFLGCLLLFALGLLVGSGASSSTFVSNNIRNTLELLSFAGTTVTAIVAVIALTSWQTQFRHSAKWKAVKNFQETLDDGEAAHNYLLCAFNMNAKNQSVPWHEKRLDFTEEFNEKQKAWVAQCSRVNKAWSHVTLFFDEREIATLKSHQEIEKNIERTINFVLEAYFKVETSELLSMYSVISTCSARARSETLELSTQVEILQKSLVRT